MGLNWRSLKRRQPVRLSSLNAANLLLLAVLTAVLAVVTNLATGLLPASWTSAETAGGWWALWVMLILGIAGLKIWQTRLEAQPTVNDDASSSAEQLSRAADELATAARDQWKHEAELRELHRSEPLRLTWSPAPPSVSAPAHTVVSDPPVGRVVRLLPGHLDEVAEKFLSLDVRRAVVLGGPGAGKTVLAMLLTLRLLEHRHHKPDLPVPVLVSLSSWDPNEKPFRDWLACRLDEDYPFLGRSTYGPRAALDLVTSGRVLPVLDGLDELSETLRAAAIDALDRDHAGKPLVLTCRPQKYAQVIKTEALATAAVVQLEPVSADEAITFLRATSTVPAAARWDPIADELHANPSGALATALSTPLMVALARRIYADSDRDPGKLVDIAKDHGQAAVEKHLLEGFVPVAMADLPPAPGAPSTGRRTWPPGRVHHWLTVLATHLHRQRTYNLAWWQLVRLIPHHRIVIGCAGGLVSGLAAGIGVGLPIGLLYGSTTGLLSGLTIGLTSAIIFGLLSGLSAHGMRPKQVKTRLRGKGWLLATYVAAGLAVGVVIAPMVGLTTGLVGGLIVGLTMGFANTLRASVDRALATPPWSVARRDRTMVIVNAVVSGVGLGLTGGFIFGFRFGLGPGIGFGLGIGVGFGLAYALSTTAWGQFTIARVWLAARGQLPWRLMTFLEDAHRLGVLRQEGAFYQFRHALLQDRLTNPNPSDSLLGDQDRD